MSALRAEKSVTTPVLRPRFRVVAVDGEVRRQHCPVMEEKLNFWTHGLGFIASLVGAVGLVEVARHLADPWQVSACIVYAATMVGVYGASTLSHIRTSPVWKHRFRTWDQVAIFMYIAGTFTPFAVTYLRGSLWMLLLPATWALALTGAGLKLFVARRARVTVTFYAFLGWFTALSLFKIAPALPEAGIALAVLGGISYSCGIYFLVNDHRAVYMHAIWHITVIGGSLCHYLAILGYVLPWPTRS